MPYTDWGIAATYCPAAGGSIACTFLLESSKAHFDVYLQSDARMGIVRIRKSEVAAVVIGKDKITIAGETWRVADIVGGELDSLEWMLAIQKEV